MNANENTPSSPEILADLEGVCRQAAAGGVRDPDLLRRIAERAKKAREAILLKHGVQDIGVQIIHEMRNARVGQVARHSRR